MYTLCLQDQSGFAEFTCTLTKQVLETDLNTELGKPRGTQQIRNGV